MHFLIIGSGTREHCIAWKLAQSKHKPKISCFASHRNPGLLELTEHLETGNITDPLAVNDFAQRIGATHVIIGPEAPLAGGVADELRNRGIPTVGPRKYLAQLETSKSFTRNLVDKYGIDASPKNKFFTSMDGVREFVKLCNDSFVIKHDGLKGGKGVLVMDDHFATVEMGISICEEIIESGDGFLLEEKLVGQEFSFFSFTDGNTLAHVTPAIQDHKRAYEGDKGPNTGGMGTYSDVDHKLPFLTDTDIAEAKEINQKVLEALQQEFDQLYQGIMYGGFMVTAHGVKLIEYNARLGDPEVFNILTLLETDLVDICLAITQQTLDQLEVSFTQQASVCKYLVPEGYPVDSVKGGVITLGSIPKDCKLFYGSVEQKGEQLVTLGSRAIALVATGESISAAEKIVEQAIQKIDGPLFHRKDIGTQQLIGARVKMMNEIRNP